MELSDVMKRNIKSYARGSIYTSLPAEVISVSSFEGQQAVDVIPLVARRYEDNTTLSSPAIEGVPVIFPSGGSGVLSFPIQVGDTVLLVFSMRSIDEWLGGDGSATDPMSARSHHISDAIAIPGLYTYTTHLQPNKDDVELKFKDEMFIQLKKNGQISIYNTTNGSSFDILVNGDIRLNTDAGDLTFGVNGDLTHFSGAKIFANGKIYSPTQIEAPSIIVDGKELKDHKHSGVTTGGGITGNNI